MSSAVKNSGAACGPSSTPMRHVAADARASTAGGTATGTSSARRASPTASTSPAASVRPCVAAEAAEGEGRPAAEHDGHVDARPARRRRCAGRRRSSRPEAQHLAGAAPRTAATTGTGRPSRSASIARAAEAHDASAGEAQGRARSRCTRARRPSARLPTARLTSRNDRSSIGPLGGTPTIQ